MSSKYWAFVVATMVGVAGVTAFLLVAIGFRFLHPDRPDLNFAVVNDRVVFVDSWDKLAQPLEVGDQSERRGNDVPPLEAGPEATEPGITVLAETAQGDDQTLAGDAGDGDSSTLPLRSESPAPKVKGKAQARARAVEYDFGILPPHADAGHVFLVDNLGQEDLYLSAGDTSCKCTIAQLPDPVIRPGQKGRVMVLWNTGERVLQYNQWASVRTSDPDQPEIQFRVQGAVSVEFATLSDVLAFEDLNPHQSHSRETFLYSQEWASFEEPRVTCTLDGFRCELELASDEEVAALQATRAYRLRVHSPADLPQGRFSGAIRVDVDGPSGQVQREILLQGAVLRRFCLYGPGVSSEGIIDLGVHRPRQGAEVKLLINLRDEDADLRLKEFSVEPDFIEAAIEPFRPRQGLYHLRLTIPKDAPLCNYLNPQDMGVLRLVLDHPRIEPQEFKLRLCIMAR